MPLARRCDDDLGRFFTEIALGAEADAADPRATSLAVMALGSVFRPYRPAGRGHGLTDAAAPMGAGPRAPGGGPKGWG
jgi:hypothetical protein